jgi:hypothetical protein
MPMLHPELTHEHSKLWRVPRLEHLTIGRIYQLGGVM